jgi:hypothetical protein
MDYLSFVDAYARCLELLSVVYCGDFDCVLLQKMVMAAVHKLTIRFVDIKEINVCLYETCLLFS